MFLKITVTLQETLLKEVVKTSELQNQLIMNIDDLKRNMKPEKKNKYGGQNISTSQQGFLEDMNVRDLSLIHISEPTRPY